jgi:uncharacterized repeat protein (TIGR03803 family)
MKPFSYRHKAFAICAVMAVLPACLMATSSAANTSARRFVVLHRFNGTDGSGPLGPLVQDAVGNLYGETEIGGSDSDGVVFELSPHGSRWTETVLHNFSYGTDGSTPLGGLTLDDQGNLYGTEFSGASSGGGVFELSPAGEGEWNLAQIYKFDGGSPRGSNPYSGVLRDAAGNLYGTTYYGGAKHNGTVFELSPAEGGGWTESVLHSFHKRPDGAYPATGVIRDSSGNLYGTTTAGGDGHCGDGEGDPSGCGTVFKLTPAGKQSTETPLYDFQRDESNFPYAPLTFGPDGLLYGTVEYDVFVLMPQDGGGWLKQTIYEFKEGEGGTITAPVSPSTPREISTARREAAVWTGSAPSTNCRRLRRGSRNGRT